MTASLSELVRMALRTAIRGYQMTLSGYLGGACRFSPSCSQFTIEAIDKHGPLRGVGLGAQRLSRCHPFHPGGFDPVP